MRSFTWAALIAGSMSSTAHAEVIMQTFDIVAQGFIPVFSGGPPAPVDPVTLNFTLTYDPTSSTGEPRSDGLTINSFNLPYPLLWSNRAEFLVVATVPYPYGGGCAHPADSFCLSARLAGDVPDVYFVQQSTGSGGFWSATVINVSVTNGTPLNAPPAVALAGLSLVGLAALRRHC